MAGITHNRVMKISLIHPSRGRAQKSFDTYNRWIDRAGIPVEVIISIDNSDESWQDYFRLHVPCPRDPIGSYTRLYGNDNKSVVEATNKAAKESTGDILIYLSDDFDCPDNWGPAVIKEFEDATGPRLIKVDDMLQPFHVPVLTIPIMNRALYERLGYFFHPDFKSMHCDEHLYHVAMKLGALKMCPHLKFEHKHVSVGKSKDDETYRRSAANWNHGKTTLERHKRMGFPI